MANRLDAPVPAGKLPEFAASKRKKAVGLAIFARPYIVQDLAGQERQGRLWHVDIDFGFLKVDGRQVAHGESPRWHIEPEKTIEPARIGELVDDAIRLRRDRFSAHGLSRSRRNPEIKNKQRLLHNVVLDFAIDMKGFHSRPINFLFIANGRPRMRSRRGSIAEDP